MIVGIVILEGNLPNDLAVGFRFYINSARTLRSGDGFEDVFSIRRVCILNVQRIPCVRLRNDERTNQTDQTFLHAPDGNRQIVDHAISQLFADENKNSGSECHDVQQEDCGPKMQSEAQQAINDQVNREQQHADVFRNFHDLDVAGCFVG